MLNECLINIYSSDIWSKFFWQYETQDLDFTFNNTFLKILIKWTAGEVILTVFFVEIVNDKTRMMLDQTTLVNLMFN